MHARHRSPGNGYRSNSMGMGMASSRISPEGSVRGHGFYGSEFRNFNRGFGRGQGHPKSFPSPHTQAQPPPPPPPPPLPPRRGDIFMEAGRLAAEYLVTQGLLPPSALSVKWQNGTLKKPMGEFQEGDGFHLQPEGRASALSRLGSAASDVGMGRRKFGDDFTPKGRRRATSFRGYGSDYSREYRRSGSWADSRTKSSADVDGDDDTASGHYQEEQQVGRDVTNGVQMSTPSDLAPKNEDAGDSESEFDKYQFQDDTSSKASSSGAGKDLQHENNGEFSRSSDDSKNVSVGIGEENDGNSIDEADKQSAKQDLTIQDNVVEGNPSDKNSSTDLLTLCKFAKVPTRTRSALTHRVPRVDTVPKTELSIAFDMQPPTGSETLGEDASLGDASSNKIHDSKSLDSEVSKAQFLQSAENLAELDSADNIEQGKFATQSFPGGASMHDSRQESSQGLAGFASSSSIAKERGEKRALEDSDSREETKKPRDWIPSLVTKGDEYFHLSNSSVKKESLPEDKATPSESMIVVIDHENLKNDSQFPNAGAEQCIDYAQEKQLFPSSYKICDLNLMGNPDTNENHDNDPMHIYDPISRNRKEVALVDVDLSMSNSKVSGGYSRHVTDGKEIEVIDLENDSTTDDKTFHNTERKTETAYTGLEGFSNNAQNTNDIPDVQDGYGLMISELLGGDFPNCSSVPGDISSMHNGMGLPNGEGSLADDDSIYMSLGEIPLSFLPAWEQPPQQGYEKPF